jgi:hypothetical protein
MCYQQPPIDLIVPHLFYTNKLVQKHNKIVFTNTSNPHLFSKQWTLITHHAYHLTNSLMIQAKLWVCILQFI